MYVILIMFSELKNIVCLHKNGLSAIRVCVYNILHILYVLYNINKLPINYIINYLFRNIKVYFQGMLKGKSTYSSLHILLIKT